VILKPCDVRRTLFPWLLTALYPFHGASERADVDPIATEVPKLPAIRKLEAAAVGLCRSGRELPGNGGAQLRGQREADSDTPDATAEHAGASRREQLPGVLHGEGSWGVPK